MEFRLNGLMKCHQMMTFHQIVPTGRKGTNTLTILVINTMGKSTLVRNLMVTDLCFTVKEVHCTKASLKVASWGADSQLSPMVLTILDRGIRMAKRKAAGTWWPRTGSTATSGSSKVCSKSLSGTAPGKLSKNSLVISDNNDRYNRYEDAQQSSGGDYAGDMDSIHTRDLLDGNNEI
jgi:hypothetical protein